MITKKNTKWQGIPSMLTFMLVSPSHVDFSMFIAFGRIPGPSWCVVVNVVTSWVVVTKHRHSDKLW